jgi:hypothetical protein
MRVFRAALKKGLDKDRVKTLEARSCSDAPLTEDSMSEASRRMPRQGDMYRLGNHRDGFSGTGQSRLVDTHEMLVKRFARVEYD